MQIGDIHVEIISGGRFKLDGGGMFGVVPRPLWTRLLTPDLDAGARGSRPGWRGATLRLRRRDMLPGTSILLAPVVLSSPRRLRVSDSHLT